MADIDEKNIPRHIAIIMDGNGRWAQDRGLNRSRGHIEGAKRVEEIIDDAMEIGVEAITLFAFSTENWSRPAVWAKSLAVTTHSTPLSPSSSIMGLKRGTWGELSRSIQILFIGRKFQLSQ